ncbi:MAG: pyrroline-5-carboxylate reductase [Nitrospirota bacterium]
MPDVMDGKQLAFIGAGQMAEALVGGLLSSRACEPNRVWATDPDAARLDVMKRRFGVRVGSSNLAAARWGDVVVLAVKPQVLADVLSELAPALPGRLVISIAAGISVRWIAGRVPQQARIIRAMPNAPALVREGMTALSDGPGVGEEDSRIAKALFESVGRVVTVEERLMDAVTGLSGSGPAYAFVAIEALADGGVKMGLPRAVAELLAAQTLLGAARMLLETDEHPGALKNRVASPGGTTIAGLHRLESGGVRACLIAAVEAATRRSEDLGR